MSRTADASSAPSDSLESPSAVISCLAHRPHMQAATVSRSMGSNGT